MEKFEHIKAWQPSVFVAKTLHYKWSCLLAVILTASLPIIIKQLYDDYISGGDKWRQADWLINFSDGLVRRGLSGEIILSLSEGISISPVAATVAVQMTIYAVIYTILIIFSIKSPINFGKFVLLASPAAFSFWV